jgi:hypothetical protein
MVCKKNAIFPTKILIITLTRCHLNFLDWKRTRKIGRWQQSGNPASEQKFYVDATNGPRIWDNDVQQVKAIWDQWAENRRLYFWIVTPTESRGLEQRWFECGIFGQNLLSNIRHENRFEKWPPLLGDTGAHKIFKKSFSVKKVCFRIGYFESKNILFENNIPPKYFL